MIKINQLFTTHIFYLLSIIFLTACGSDGSDDTGAGISNTKPIAHIIVNEPTDITIGSTITFDGSTSSDSDGDHLTYQWILTSKPVGSSASLSSTTTEAPTITIDAYGTYAVQLLVSDHELASNLDTAEVIVENLTLLDKFGFEDNTSSGFTGDWVVIDTKANSGTYSLQPPSLVAASTTSTELIYNTVHTQISFAYSGSQVDFYIDDVYYASFSTLFNLWESTTIIVPEGIHTYRWSVTTIGTGQPNVYLDDIQFIINSPVSNSTGPYGFEEGFLTPEFIGGWDIDDSRSHSGVFSLRAPYMSSAGTSTTELVYNTNHTQVSFFYSGSTAVDLYIDDVYYASFSTLFNLWESTTIIVPEGIHTYRWSVTTTGTGRPDIYLDDINFSHTTSATNPTGPYGFEEGFLTNEITGDWNIDDSRPHSGNYSLRAPYMTSAGTASAELVYNTAHTEISFWHNDANVDLYIDDMYYASYSTLFDLWENVTITVPEGAHTYRWSVTATDAGRPSAFLDDISLQ